MRVKKILSTLGIGVFGVVLLALAAALLAYPAEYVYRVFVWQESDAFDWQKFPSHPLTAAPAAFHFGEAADPRVAQLFQELSGAQDWHDFLEENQSQAFIVIQDGKIRYENYFNNTQRDSIVTSFSVAKSFGSALIGKALEDGYLGSVDDPITKYLPELAPRDLRFHEITIRHLLLMASGLEYEEFRPLLLNGDDPLTTYFPNQRKIALENTRVIDPPGLYFWYKKYHPQLLGMILERATGMAVTDYLQTRIWDPLGMEFDGSWSTDSRGSDFEKMETGVNARAIDFAKFGALYLNGGDWNGRQVLWRSWIDDSTRPLLPEDYADYYPDWVKAKPGRGYYTYMWWGMARADGSFDFTAEGDKGQFIYVSPSKNLVIVRNGIDYGIPSEEWLGLFFDFADRYGVGRPTRTNIQG